MEERIDNELHRVWSRAKAVITKERTELDLEKYNDFLASIFCPGPFCYFVIDFYDMSIVQHSDNIRSIIAIDGDITLDNIIATNHPDDLRFIAEAERAYIDFLYNNIGREKVLKYKLNRCFRAKHPSGEYRMICHQGIILTVDVNGGFGKALNIFTDISHLTSTNNYRISIIGLGGEPSFQNIDIGYRHASSNTVTDSFSSREKDIIRMIRDGLHSKEIAAQLNISLHTVNTHRKNILSKSKSKSMSNLIARCTEEGIL